MIKIDIDYLIFNDKYSFTYPCIIPYKTGVFYTAQVGGNLCLHPEIEGYLIFLSNDKQIESCKYFCCRDNKDDIIFIDEFLRQFSNKVIELDYDKIHELTEGWIPIKIKENGEYSWNKLYDLKGYLFTGNCD